MHVQASTENQTILLRPVNNQRSIIVVLVIPEWTRIVVSGWRTSAPVVGKQSPIDGGFVVGDDRRDVADVDDGSCRSGGGGGASGDDGGVGVGVASRRARHPRVAGARVTRGYHRRVVIAVGVYVGGGWSGRGLLMVGQSLLLLLAQHLVGKIFDQGEGLPSLVAHQAHGGFFHYVVE